VSGFPSGQNLNLYAYVRNNPTSLGDLDGHAIQLSNDEEKRKQQLAAAQQAVGKQGAKYLYDNTAEDFQAHFLNLPEITLPQSILTRAYARPLCLQ